MFLKFRDEKSSKYWAATTLEDGRILVQYGKIGHKLGTYSTYFKGTYSTYNNTKKIDTLINSKIKKGYKIITNETCDLLSMSPSDIEAKWNEIHNKKQKNKNKKKLTKKKSTKTISPKKSIPNNDGPTIEESQQLEKLDKNIAEKQLMISKLKLKIKDMANEIAILELKMSDDLENKKILTRIIRRRPLNSNGYNGKAWDSAVKFVKKELESDEYLASAWIRPIKGAKKGDVQHEWAYFEPCNRGNGGMGCSIVGIHAWENDPKRSSTCSLNRKGILELFHTNDSSTLKYINSKFDKMDILLKKDDEESYEEYEEILYDTIDTLLDFIGFEKV